jgi:hypothetical protein
MGNSYKCFVVDCTEIVKWHNFVSPGIFACDEHADVEKSETMDKYIQNIASTIKF